MTRTAPLLTAALLAVFMFAPSAALAQSPEVPPTIIVSTTCSDFTWSGFPGSVFFSGVPQTDTVIVQPGNLQDGPDGDGNVQFTTMTEGDYTWQSGTLYGDFTIATCPDATDPDATEGGFAGQLMGPAVVYPEATLPSTSTADSNPVKPANPLPTIAVLVALSLTLGTCVWLGSRRRIR